MAPSEDAYDSCHDAENEKKKKPNVAHAQQMSTSARPGGISLAYELFVQYSVNQLVISKPIVKEKLKLVDGA
jgi:hypothetical protein